MAFLDNNGVRRFWAHIVSQLNHKVEKVDGKGLSTNDFTTEEKEKLAGIAEGAEVNVQFDWDADENESGHILNRTHYIETVEGTILDNAYSDTTMEGLFVIAQPLASNLTLGSSYHVIYNGTSYYDCVCSEVELFGMKGLGLGNTQYLGGPLQTDHPFSFVAVPDDMVESFGLYGGVLALDGASNVTISILGVSEVIHKIDNKYINFPNSFLRNGSSIGSLRGAFTATEDEEYKMGQQGFAIGYNTKASNFHAFASGQSTIASGSDSHASGYSTKASGAQSHAEGYETEASGISSHAEGDHTIASGYSSHAEGRHTKALKEGSHAEGLSTEASADNSHAEGQGTKALGIGSHAEGTGTIASGHSSHVQGKYNIEDTQEKYAHIVGNGPWRGKESNAHTLDWDGNARFAGSLYVNGTGASDLTDAKIVATQDYVDTKVASIVDSAPETLNTLNELAAALGDDQNFATTVSTEIGKKVDKTTTINGKTLEANITLAVEDIDGAVNENSLFIEKVVELNSTDGVVYTGAIPGITELYDNLVIRVKPNYTSTSRTIKLNINNYGENNIVYYQIRRGRSYGNFPVENWFCAFSTYTLRYDKSVSAWYVSEYSLLDLVPYLLINNSTINGIYSRVAINETDDYKVGSGSLAMGNACRASGDDSAAFGRNTHARGAYSHTMGYVTTAQGDMSSAEGEHTYAASNHQHVQGKYNIVDIANKYAHIVGNGDWSNDIRSNAHTLDWSGNAWFAGIVKVGGTSQDDENAKELLAAPPATESDNGKVLGVVNGAYGLVNMNINNITQTLGDELILDCN